MRDYYYLCTVLPHSKKMKTNCEYTEILNDLILHLSDLKTRRRSAGRRLLVEFFTADAAELTQTLQNEVLAKVSREIVLDADEGIDYPALGDSLQNLLPIELPKPTTEEQAAVAELNKAVEALSAVLLQIAEELDRRHADEEYVKLYENEVKKYMRYYGNSTLRDYKAFSEGDCLGSPTMEELENYRAEKLLHLFETGIFSESVAHKRSAKRYPDEVVLPVPDKDSPIAEKDVHKHYFCLRKICDFVDGCLVVNPSKAGHYFYAHRNDRKAKEQRTNFLKYMMKIRLAQQEMTALRLSKANALPPELGSAEAMHYWQLLAEKGFVDKSFKLSAETTRKQAMYIAEAFAERLGLKSKWKLFQDFWGIGGLAQEKWDMQQTGVMPTRYKEIDEIFKSKP